jgi:hypothetical protein
LIWQKGRSGTCGSHGDKARAQPRNAVLRPNVASLLVSTYIWQSSTITTYIVSNTAGDPYSTQKCSLNHETMPVECNRDHGNLSTLVFFGLKPHPPPCGAKAL